MNFRTLMIYAATALFICLTFDQVALAQISHAVSYQALLSQGFKSEMRASKVSETDFVLSIISDQEPDLYAAEITAALKKSYPVFNNQSPIQIPKYVMDSRVVQGKEFDRMNRIIKPLLRFMWLEDKILPVLYESDQPVLAFTNPKALIISSRALTILNDEEVEALAAHEICHLIAFDSFKIALDTNNESMLRIIELFCDAGSAAILKSKNKNPKCLISGLEKMIDVLKIENNFDDRKGDHPTMKVRRKLNDLLCQRFDSAGRNSAFLNSAQIIK